MIYNNSYYASQPQNQGYGQSYAPYQGGYYYNEIAAQQYFYQQPTRPEAVVQPIAQPEPQQPEPQKEPASDAVEPIAWTNQPLARIFIRPQQYTAAASAEETLRMGTAFPELFRPVGGTQ